MSHNRWVYFFATGKQKHASTRLTYNCAHLRSTKDSLTIEYFRIIKKIGVKILWVKIFLCENFLGENFLGENSLWMKFFGLKII